MSEVDNRKSRQSHTNFTHKKSSLTDIKRNEQF